MKVLFTFKMSLKLNCLTSRDIWKKNACKRVCLWYFRSKAELGLHHKVRWSIQNFINLDKPKKFPVNSSWCVWERGRKGGGWTKNSAPKEKKELPQRNKFPAFRPDADQKIIFSIKPLVTKTDWSVMVNFKPQLLPILCWRCLKLSLTHQFCWGHEYVSCKVQIHEVVRVCCEALIICSISQCVSFLELKVICTVG